MDLLIEWCKRLNCLAVDPEGKPLMTVPQSDSSDVLIDQSKALPDRFKDLPDTPGQCMASMESDVSDSLSEPQEIPESAFSSGARVLLEIARDSATFTPLKFVLGGLCATVQHFDVRLPNLCTILPYLMTLL